MRRVAVVLLVLVTVVALGVTASVRGWLPWPPGPDGSSSAGSDREGESDGDRPRVVAPVEGRVLATVGVVSQNIEQVLSRRQQRADMDRITSDPRADVIGWQEAASDTFASLHPRYRARGWATEPFGTASNTRETAISWRTRTFALVGSRSWLMHRGAVQPRTTHPFPHRYVTSVTLRHRASGLTVTVLNTHVNHHVETGQEWQDNLNARLAKRHYRLLARLYRTVPGDVVVGTGDYNWDFHDDDAARPAGGITRTFAGAATSSFRALGLDGTEPTRNTRWIDYVFLADRSLRDTGQVFRIDGSAPARAVEPRGAAQFVTHRTLSGYRSDHRPLLARIRLYDPVR